jgi:hypothetical protein
MRADDASEHVVLGVMAGGIGLDFGAPLMKDGAARERAT